MKNQTAPLVEFYKQKSLLSSISGEGDINQIYNSIREAITQ